MHCSRSKRIAGCAGAALRSISSTRRWRLLTHAGGCDSKPSAIALNAVSVSRYVWNSTGGVTGAA
eukprot:scaffold169941_cov28-Tisochrysis_lutea.AAC.1